MSTELFNADAFNSIKSEAIERLLKQYRWELARVVSNDVVILKKVIDRKQNLVWLPLNEGFTDYGEMVARLVETVSRVDNKPVSDIADELQTRALGDVICVSTYDPLDVHDHTLPLNDGVSLVLRARMLARAAALSATYRKSVYGHGRLSEEASRFMQDLRLGQTERGSYVVRLIAPMADREIKEEGTLPDFPDRRPFARRATISLVSGLAALRSAAEDNRKRGRFAIGPYLESVRAGVSANLCEAIASTDERQGQHNTISVRVIWSYALETNDIPAGKPFTFEPDTIPYIRKAAQHFRETHPEITRLVGYVRITGRDSRSGPGVIRLRTRIGASYRSVKIELDSSTYQRAVDAHREGSYVEVSGVLEKDGWSFKLNKPTEFAVMPADRGTSSEMFDTKE